MEKGFKYIAVSAVFAKEVLDKAIEKFKAGEGKSKMRLDVARGKLNEKLKELNWLHKFNIKTYYDTLNASNQRKDNQSDISSNTRNEQKLISQTSVPFVTLIILLIYLKKAVHIDSNIQINLTDSDTIDISKSHLILLINDLMEQGLIAQECSLRQLYLLGENLQEPSNWKHYFLCYYSQGEKDPDIALLKIDADNEKVYMKFAKRRRRGSIHLGVVRNIPTTVSTVFVDLVDKETSIPSMLSLRTSRLTESIYTATELHGYYCSALDYNGGTPVAGQVVLIRVENEHEALKILQPDSVPVISTEIYTLLYNKRFVIKDPEIGVPFTGIYRGYWYLVKDSYQEVRQIKLEFFANGRAKLDDVDMSSNDGTTFYVPYNNNRDGEKGGILKIYFDFRGNLDYRLSILFNVSNLNATYFDGVYSGQRYRNDNKLMAGKIRIYPDNNAFEIRNYKFDTSLPTDLKQGDKLLDFFWGRDVNNSSNNFLQPNFNAFQKFKSIFDDAYLSNNANETAKIEKYFRKRWAGTYKLLKLDSRRKVTDNTIDNRINTYLLKVDAYGNLAAKMYISGDDEYENQYLGKFIHFEHYIIVDFTELNNENWHAKYIFWVGKNTKYDINNMFGISYGVYTSIGGDGHPISGRAILQIDTFDYEKAIENQIEVGSERYYLLDKKISTLLTGFTDNLLKSPKSIDVFKRKIDFGHMFFLQACYLAKQKSSMNSVIENLIFAFEHGFRNISLLQQELASKETLLLLTEVISIRELGDIFYVKIINGISETEWQVRSI